MFECDYEINEDHVYNSVDKDFSENVTVRNCKRFLSEPANQIAIGFFVFLICLSIVIIGIVYAAKSLLQN